MTQFAGHSIRRWFSFFLTAALSLVRPVLATCVPPGTPADDNIICSDADFAGVSAGSGNDTITVLPGAAIQVEDSGPSAGAVAIDAGPDNDSVSNAGSVTVDAQSVLSPVIIFPPVPSSVWDITTTGEAIALGLDFGSGIDSLLNFSLLGISAFAQIDSVAVVGTLDSVGSVLASSTATARAAAASGVGAVTIANGGPTQVAASASADALSVSVRASGGTQPLWLGGTNSAAQASGFVGHGLDDRIENFGSVTVGATAASRSLDAAVSLDGFAASATASRASAEVAGILGEAGADRLLNNGDLDLGAVAAAQGVSVGLGIDGAVTGDAAGVVLSDASVHAKTLAVGIDGGDGNDTAGGSGRIAASATSAATAVGASVDIAVAQDGSVVGAALSDASVTATAAATAIAAGAGADQIEIGGEVDLTAAGSATGVAVSLTIAGSVDDNASGGTLSDAAVVARSAASGVDGGDGVDYVSSSASISVTADATSTGVSASLPVVIAREGKAEGASLSNVSVTAEALTSGIDAGMDESGDVIDNRGVLDLNATSQATGVAAALTVAGSAKGEAGGSALSDSSVTANAGTVGLVSGGGNDRVASTGTVGATADASATGVSASLTVGFTAEGDVVAEASAEGGALSNASTRATARAVGIDTGEGADTIDNQGELALIATAQATGVAVSLEVAGSAKGDVAGAALSDASVTAASTTRGIAAGEGIDAITNTARIGATATATGLGVSASVPVVISQEGKAEGSAISNVSVAADAAATGVDAGADESGDVVDNRGVLDLNATSQATGVAASVTVAGTAKGDVGGSALSDSSVTANAATVGLVSGGGHDRLTNTGAITATSDATATGVSASVRVGFTKDGAVQSDASAEGTALSNASSHADAWAVGIDAGSGADTVENQGDLALKASSTATGVAASIDVAASAKGDVAGGALADASVTSTANVSGIAAGGGDDTVSNDHAILGDVVATATGAAAGVSVSITKEGTAEGAALSDASATASVTATGIDGGESDDTITNSGTIRLQHLDGSDDADEARATAVAASVGVAGSAKGAVSGKALADASSHAEADAAAIASGAGADTIINSGEIVADMDAVATTVAASVSVAINVDSSEEPDPANATASALSDASATAIAQSRGIDAGAGPNRVDSTGQMELAASADATSVAVSLSVAGTANGDAAADALAEASSSAQARSAGIAGGNESDTVHSQAKITGAANATATTVAASAGVAITLNGAASGASLSDSSANATAIATGLDGGEGRNDLESTADIALSAQSVATSVAVSLTVAGTAGGDAAGSALSKASSDAESTTLGIGSGGGSDRITNRAGISVDSGATGKTVAVGAGVSVSLGGNAQGSALSDASSTARANATAIDAGAGDDTITNEGDIVLMPAAPGDNDIEADARSVAVSVIAAGAVGGDTKGNALSNASALAEARGNAIAAGAGNDTVDNIGAISGQIDAHAASVAAAAGVQVSVGGSSAGAAVSDASSTARAAAIGIGGGEGTDRITNSGDITLQSGAAADGVSLAIFLGGTLGTADQSAIANARTAADAASVALDGGSGPDHIDNSGAIDVGATATLEGRSWAVNVSLLSGGLTTQSAVADVSGTASASAVAIAGGDDADYVRNTAPTTTVTAASTARTSAYSISLSGLSVGVGVKQTLGQTSTTAVSTAAGLTGGEGADDIGMAGATTVTATATSEGTATARNLSIVGIGGELQEAAAKSTTTAQAIARGVDGGGANDKLSVGDMLEVGAEANVTGVAVATNVSGVSLGATAQKSVAQAGTVADALAVGIDGGAGGNVIDNAAAITLDATATATTRSVSAGVSGFSLAGATFQDAAADASTTVMADGSGILGGEQMDRITSTGALSVRAESTANVVSRSEVFSLTFFGSASGRAASDASAVIAASGRGIDGGAGDDMIIGTEQITVDAISAGTVNANASARAGVVFGDASAKTATSGAGDVSATAAGIAGGAGRDSISSTALVDVLAQATLGVTASSVSVASATFGAAYAAAAADSSSSTHAVAAGIDGGEDADTIRNDGGVTVDAIASTTVNQTTVAIANTVFGPGYTVANSNATARGSAAATGVAAGGGDDRIESPRDVTVTAEGTVTMQRLTLSSDGPATADAMTEAQVSAVGIDGGGGNDTIVATGDITVSATGSIGSGSRTGGASVDEDVRITASTRAVGITGGEGSDFIDSAGDMVVSADSHIDSQGVTFAGVTVLKSRLTADATAIGIDGGGGEDAVTSSTGMTVTAGAGVLSKQSTYSFGGGEATSFLQAQAASSAFSASNSLDLINRESVNSRATATVTGEDTTISFSGYVTKDLRGRAQSTATGLLGGALDDRLDNRAELRVDAMGTVTSTGRIQVDFDEGTDQQLRFEALAQSLGTSTGDGNDSVTNAAGGVMLVNANAMATVNGVTSTCDGFWGCGWFGWLGEQTWNWADGLSESTGWGVDLGQGRNVLDNAGRIDVRSDANGVVSAVSDADVYGETNAYADSTSTARAWGVRGAGADQVSNRETGAVMVDASATATAVAQGGQIGGTEIDLKSAVSETASAGTTTFVDASQINKPADAFVGKWVRFLTGDNAEAYALVTSFDSTKGQFTLQTALVSALAKGDQYTVSEARNATSGAFATAIATGIELQGSDAVVRSAGILDVRAAATADDFAKTFGGAAEVSAVARATARGIVTGDGNDVVHNTGTITVQSEAAARINGAPAGDATATAIGVDTGSGDDLIVNEGVIHTSAKVRELLGFQPVAGTAIRAGAGNDRVELGASSVTAGLVQLDDGDDRLTVIGGAQVTGLDGGPGTLNGGAGTDSLVLRGAGSFSGDILAFEHTSKEATGTFTLSSLPSMRRLEISGGTLQTTTAYTFDSSGTYSGWIYGGGEHGKLRVESSDAQLAGTLKVIKGHGGYVDQTKYLLVETADPQGVTGAFDEVVLPAATGLLSFSYEQLPNGVQVTAAARSFTTLAGNDLERAMAGYLDQLLPNATGDLSDVLGELQDLPAAQVGPMMATLSPGAYESGTRASQSMAQQYTHMLQQHLSGLRMRGGPGASGVGVWLPSGQMQQAVFLAYNDIASNADAGVGGVVGREMQLQEKRRWGVWLDSFGQWGEQDAVDGFAGLDYDMAGLTLGVDYAPSDRWIIGGSANYARSSTDLAGNGGNGDVDTVGASLYATWFSGPLHVDGVLSYGKQSYDNSRNLTIGGLQRTAVSSHDGDLWAAYLGVGYDVRRGSWVFEPYGALHYVYLSEDGFQETGAGSVSLRVDNRNSDALVSELGVRVARIIEAGAGRWVPEVRAAWNYDFDLGNTVITGTFVSSPGAAFAVPGAPAIGSGATLGAGVTYVHRNGFSTAVQVNAELRDGYSAYGVLGYIRYAF